MRLYSNKFNNYSSMLFGTAVVAAIIVTLPTSTYAANSQEVAQIAKKTTVQINNEGTTSPGGSGVIIAKEGNTYTVLTANHVVCDALDRPGEIVCSSDITYSVRTSIGKDYPVKDIKVLQKSKNDADLAVVTFEATEDYPVATLGNSDQAEIAADIFVAGFPAVFGTSGAARDFAFTKGLVVSRASSAINGYSLIYDARTVTGNSGGPVFDVAGRLVAIHGLADTSTQSKSETGNLIPQKSGFNAGIPINTFLAMRSQISSSSSIKQDNTPTGVNPSIRLSDPQSARDFYARGLTKVAQQNYQGAIEDYNKAIHIDPNYAEVYIGRGVSYELLNNYEQAIEDYNQAIRIDPNYAEVYFLRGHSYSKLYSRLDNDEQAIKDYNQAIRIDPNYAKAYLLRGQSYYMLENNQEALANYQKAAQLYQQQGNIELYQLVLDIIKDLPLQDNQGL
ncbi:tetratricopeptide repeat-containing serine protease family protein [Nostoc sp. CALU 546]|uniref:tetratricopeptide repeat-containing S1 family peptidase n=1 Tax=Nostoc sp. CALU 546 TaxID=1867241 RepID=UPI003B6827C8